MENIKVSVRVRPILGAERRFRDVSCVEPIANGKRVQIRVNSSQVDQYRCNKCFDKKVSQAQVFYECGVVELLESAMKGLSVSIVLFGQAGSGKSFTLLGPSKGLGSMSKHSGLIARSISYLFAKLEDAEVAFTLKLSCLEICDEEVLDIFAAESDKEPLVLKESSNGTYFYPPDCRKISIASADDAILALEEAMRNRVSTLNEAGVPSPWHCVTEIHIEVPMMIPMADKRNGDAGGVTRTLSLGKISFVDLVASESLQPERINSDESLFVLTKVIDGTQHVNNDNTSPSDSTLTKLLMQSLGKRDQCALISCVYEAKYNTAESLKTLKFR